MRLSLQRHIDAPIETVFEAIARTGSLAGDADGLAGIERMKRRGSGAEAHQPYSPGGPRGTPALEVTEYRPPESVGLVTRQRGMRWETLFSARPENGGTLLAIHMEVIADSRLSRLSLPLMRGTILRSLQSDIDRVEAWCAKRVDRPASAP